MSDAILGLSGVLVWTAAARYPTMRAFYIDTLELIPRSDRERFVNFDWGSQRLTVSVHEGVLGTTSDPLRLMINLDVDDIHAVAKRLNSNGVEFTRPPTQEPWGGWVATFHDPDGNTLQLLQIPG
jgi:catechol 2,3-dioxygenase-like lactoylglutathione lyase family enzyme